MLARLRFILWGLVVVVGLGAAALYMFRAPADPIGLFGGKFTLQTTSGTPFHETDLKGTPSLIFFGYTYCPDVCPTTLAEAVGWREALKAGPDKLRIIFVTVDPDRDTADVLRTYLNAFSPDIIGLRGDNVQTEAAKKAFGVYSQKVKDPSNATYLVDHTANVFLINGKGSFEGTISYGEARNTALAKIRKLLGT